MPSLDLMFRHRKLHRHAHFSLTRHRHASQVGLPGPRLPPGGLRAAEHAPPRRRRVRAAEARDGRVHIARDRHDGAGHARLGLPLGVAAHVRRPPVRAAVARVLAEPAARVQEPAVGQQEEQQRGTAAAGVLGQGRWCSVLFGGCKVSFLIVCE